MCEKCVEIDDKIEQYRLMASRITDEAMLEGIAKMIAQLQAIKLALHPERAN